MPDHYSQEHQDALNEVIDAISLTPEQVDIHNVAIRVYSAITHLFPKEMALEILQSVIEQLKKDLSDSNSD